jgi:hypothetical protein
MKANTVDDENTQDMSEYKNMSTATVSISTAFIIISTVTFINKYDVTATIVDAYSNATMKADVYKAIHKQILTVTCSTHSTILKYRTIYDILLIKIYNYIYNITESAPLCNEEPFFLLLYDGLKLYSYDPYIFNKTVNNMRVTNVFYVDDLLITSVKISTIKKLLNYLVNEYKSLFIIREKKYDNPSAGKLIISLETLIIQAILQKYEISRNIITSSINILLNITEGNKTLFNLADNEIFNSTVAKLSYLEKSIYPDNMLKIQFLVSRAHDKDNCHLHRLYGDPLYLNKIKNKIKVFKIENNSSIYVYFNSSSAVHADIKSNKRINLKYDTTYFTGQYSERNLITKSSIAAELIAIYYILPITSWIHNFILRENTTINQVILFEVNRSTISLIKNEQSTSASTRHFNINHHFIKDQINNNEINMFHLPTNLMRAELMTRPIQDNLFKIDYNLILGQPTENHFSFRGVL